MLLFNPLTYHRILKPLYAITRLPLQVFLAHLSMLLFQALHRFLHSGFAHSQAVSLAINAHHYTNNKVFKIIQ
ncbi:hypothetical protein [Helicobacter cinaedi]|uniref:hypothetical protein n=1 Tax=Helicobacter cinaedi TaxID=213 RepID=UPI00215D7044|nr:hypothetical protein [Helicobacter cinaedi]